MYVRAVVGSLILALASPLSWAAPQRIVSLNLCADELVLRLAAPGTVRSVTWLARDPSLSNVADMAHAVPINRGLAEEIVPLAPDLVIVGAYTARTTVGLLKSLGIPMLELGVVNNLDQARQQIAQVAHALGRAEQGAQLIGDISSRISALPPAPDTRPVAAIYQPNGFTIGEGTLVNDLMRRAGVRNLAVERRIDQYGRLPLELLLQAQPDFLIMSTGSPEAPALAYEILQHPALMHSYRADRVIDVPSAWWSCPGPRMVDAIERLQQGAKRLTSRSAGTKQ